MDDLLEEFIAETRETLEILSGQLVEWEKNPDDLKLVDSVFRFVHTVKGSCGFLDLPRLAKMSHAAEDVLSAARDGALEPTTELVSAVLAVIDHIAALTDALETGEAVFDRDDELITALVGHLKNVDGAGEFLQDSSSDDVSEVEQEAQSDEEVAEKAEPHSIDKNKTVRVSLNVLDQLMNGVSDLVLARNEVSRQIRRSGGNLDIDHSFTRLSSIVADMRDSIGLMRMQSIDRLFSTLPRLLRDANVELGKDIELEISGAAVEVDREMVEALRDPLTHIIRNAADHGIEASEDRIAVGKDPVGKISISARQSGNQILIEISDDGRGIDVEKLRQRAVGAKLVTEQRWQSMSEHARLSMIFEPGLSTASKVTSISGRGVGMDVVRSNLQSIGGTIELENFAGQGLTMTLRLPLTLTIIAGLSVQAGDEIFGISRNSVEEILSMTNQNVIIEKIGGTKIAVIRDERMPYVRLEDILKLDGGKENRERTLIVVNPAVGGRFVLDVDSVIDHEEMVVKPGAPLVMKTGLYAGTSLPDNGRPMLLLDASGLASAIGCAELDEILRDTQRNKTLRADETAVGDSALLFTNISGRKQAVRLGALDRMEDVSVDKIKFVGQRLRVSIDDDLIDLFGIDEIPKGGVVQLLRFSDGSQRKCLAVSDVIDTFTLDGKITPSAAPELHEGVVSAFGEPVELINVYQYFETSDEALDSRKNRALCFVPSDDGSGWERNFLGPLLAASGYRVTHDPGKAGDAEIIVSVDGSVNMQVDENRLVKLFGDQDRSDDGVYKYDRAGVLAAIKQKLSGAA